MELYSHDDGTIKYNTTTDRNKSWNSRNDPFDPNLNRDQSESDRNRFGRFKRQFNDDQYRDFNRNRNQDNNNNYRDNNNNNRENQFGRDPFRGQDPYNRDLNENRNNFDGNFDGNRFDDKQNENDTVYYEKFDIFHSVPKYGINHNLMFSVRLNFFLLKGVLVNFMLFL